MSKLEEKTTLHQAIYIDLNANSWKDKIVFLEPIFEDLHSAIVPLQSMVREDMPQLVVSGTKERLIFFRSEVCKLDDEENLGENIPKNILIKLQEAVKKASLSVPYLSSGNFEENEEIVKGFFDPLTQRKIVKHGPHYFDPSLVTLEEANKLSKQRYEKHQKLLKKANASLGNCLPRVITNDTMLCSCQTKSIPRNFKALGTSKHIVKYLECEEGWIGSIVDRESGKLWVSIHLK